MPLIQPTYFTINGVRYQHASLEINFGIPGFGLPTLGLQEMSYDESLEPGELRGTSPVVIGVTTGKYSTTAKLKVPKAEAAFLVQQINTVAAANPDPLGNVMGYGQWPFTITLNYYDVGQPLQTDILNQCRIKKMADASKIGPDPLYVDIDLFVIALERNGFFMVNPTTIQPQLFGT